MVLKSNSDSTIAFLWSRVVMILVLPLLVLRYVLSSVIELAWYQYHIYWYVAAPMLIVLLSASYLRKKLSLHKENYLVLGLLTIILAGSQLLYSGAIYQRVKSVEFLEYAIDFPQYKFFNVSGRSIPLTFNDFEYVQEIKQETIARRRANRRMKEGLHFKGMALKNISSDKESGEIRTQLWLVYEINHYIRGQYQLASDHQKGEYLSEVELKLLNSETLNEYELMSYELEKSELLKKISQVFPGKISENDWIFVPSRNSASSSLFWSVGLMVSSYVVGLWWLRRTRKY